MLHPKILHFFLVLLEILEPVPEVIFLLLHELGVDVLDVLIFPAFGVLDLFQVIFPFLLVFFLLQVNLLLQARTIPEALLCYLLVFVFNIEPSSFGRFKEVLLG